MVCFDLNNALSLKLDGEGKLLPPGPSSQDDSIPHRVPAQKVSSATHGTLMPRHLKPPTAHQSEAK